MEKGYIAETIRKLLRSELDDCERALKENDIKRAKIALDEATRKLKHLANCL
jgi:hypothetical protein